MEFRVRDFRLRLTAFNRKMVLRITLVVIRRTIVNVNKKKDQNWLMVICKTILHIAT